MRGICALMVVVFHCDTVLNNGHLLNHAWLCVDMFFVLSGFVIAMAYEDRLAQKAGFSYFMRARARRLLPVQFIGTLAVALSVLALYASGRLQTPAVTAGALLLAALYGMFLIPNLLWPIDGISNYSNQLLPINPPLWSLLDEWILNIAYGAILHAVRTSLLVAISAGLAVALFYNALHSPFSWNAGTTETDMMAGIARAGLGFIAGVVVWRLQAKGRLAHLPAIKPELVYAAWFFVCAVPKPRAYPIFEGMAAAMIAPMAIALLVRGERPIPRLFLALGALSYPLYASHFTIVNLASIWLDREVERHNALLALPMLISAILLAWLINHVSLPKTTRRPPQEALELSTP